MSTIWGRNHPHRLLLKISAGCVRCGGGVLYYLPRRRDALHSLPIPTFVSTDNEFGIANANFYGGRTICASYRACALPDTSRGTAA